jgi:hypothetical protein
MRWTSLIALFGRNASKTEGSALQNSPQSTCGPCRSRRFSSSKSNREVTVERDQQEAIARQEQMVEELHKAELVRDRLQGLNQIASLYPEGHPYRSLIEALELDRALEVVEEDIRRLRDALVHPRGT